MGAFSGTVNARSYRVLGMPDDWKVVINELRRNRFKDLDPASGREKSSGWVLADDPFSSDFGKENVFYGNAVVLALRMDVLSVPPAQLRLLLEKAAREKLKKEGREALSKQERKEMMEELRFDLMKKALPSIRLSEMVWDTDSKRLWFFGRSPAMVEAFEELFKETFGVTLLHDSPYTVAAGLLGGESADRMFEWEQGLLSEKGE